MGIRKLRLDGLVVFEGDSFVDQRGQFNVLFKEEWLKSIGFRGTFLQENCSWSRAVGTIRGLHFQRPPHGQAKLVRCSRGALLDVAVDIRDGSPTYGEWESIELSENDGLQLFIPEGFAHGFVTRAPGTEIVYKCSAYYSPESEGVLRFDDPDIGIDWGLDASQAILSEKDRNAGYLSHLNSPFRCECGK